MIVSTVIVIEGAEEEQLVWRLEKRKCVEFWKSLKDYTKNTSKLDAR